MTSGNYRILEQTLNNGYVKYIVQRYAYVGAESMDWMDVGTATTLEQARKMKEQLHGVSVKSERVIE